MRKFQRSRSSILVKYKYLHSMFIAYLLRCTNAYISILSARGNFVAPSQLHDIQYFN